ncbi:MAG: glycosyltransferase family 2 protein [Planctomycetes bacterium]|nr:glycosyltransferase family 2 protein [Planctomycetota bacterium]
MEKSENPRLSIIIASEDTSRIEDCLNALRGQVRSGEIETIVVVCSADGTTRLIKTKFPDVKFISFSSRKSLPLLLGAGIEQSTGDIVAITDATCVVDGNWISEILKAHKTAHPVIGGGVEMAIRKGMINWAAYFCEYGQFMHPMEEGVVNELPGNNMSFKRWVLKRGQEFVQNGFWKTYWCRKLQEEGIQLISKPSIVVHYKKSFCLGSFLIRRFLHGRCFAGMRIAKVSIFKRMYYIAGSPLLVFLFLARTIKAIIPKKRYRKEFILSFPVSFMAIVIWSVGEFYGYLTGPGSSCNKIYIH